MNATREIRWDLLCISGIVYRLSVMAIQTLFFLVVYGNLGKAFNTSLWLNIVSMIWYYVYHSEFAKHFKLGK